MNFLTVSAGEGPLPGARVEELIYVLEELSHLIVHPDSVSVLHLHPYLKDGLAKENNHDKRPHLLVLFPFFCELVISR